ncbi:response regulator [Nostoc sp. LEGE 12447]|uniref:response regulator n=1 Tax=Nostoc sp. LEGE 12447 TaxID=1828640 RepID=UPI001883C751|nr:response regulator [Nostoc sp. LEGE 12447]MBE9002141.1 response regulator [Nostoc sp. LEGE 12447]
MNNHQIQLAKANILVVDDTPDNLRLLSAMLTQLGYEIRRVINGPTALKTAQAAPPDLILLDIMMPEMNGYEVCQHLKASEITRDIPVIFISALDEVFDKVKAFAVGGVDYITKPFSEEEVFARVENNLTIRRLQKQLTEQNLLLQQEISVSEAARRGRQKAESALRLSQFYLDRFREPIFFVNSNAQLIYVNEAACQILGYSREKLLTMTVHDIDPNFPAETWHSQWQELRQKDSSSFESIHQTEDGRNLDVKITFSYLEFKDQEYLCTSAYYPNTY